jgi:outer membrane protein assembly factor BamA
MLRDHVVFLDLSVYGSFDYTQGLALYENRSRRLGWSAGAFHFVQQNLDQLDRDVQYLQRDFGIVGALRYPLDRFRRLELELILGGVQRYCATDFSSDDPAFSVTSCNGITEDGSSVYVNTDGWRDRNAGVAFNIQPAVRFGYDTIRYDFATGPVAGRSFLLELGGGYLPGREAIHGFSRIDAQQYFQLSGRANLGLRAAAGTTFSPNEQSRLWSRTWWLTSADNLRGFYPLDFENLTGLHYYVANLELQVPLDPIVRLVIFDYIEGIAALDFGGVFDRWSTRTSGEVAAPLVERGAWDSRTLTGVLGVNVLFGPLLLRVHFGHPFDIGGVETPAMRSGDSWVTNVTLRYFFF